MVRNSATREPPSAAGLEAYEPSGAIQCSGS